MLKERVLNSVGEDNYNEYMLLTNGEEINSILDSKSPAYEMYKYREQLLNEQKEVSINMDNLKKSLENIFLDYLSDGSFKTVKNMLDKHIGGWSIDRLLEIHKKHKYDRIFSILTINYEKWKLL